MNVGLSVERNAILTPDAVAVFDNSGTLTYAELDCRANRFAHVITERYGLMRGDRLALFVPNRREVIEVMVGCAKVGIVYVGLNFRLDRNELRQVLSNAEPKLIVVAAELAEQVRPLAVELEIPYLEQGDTSASEYEQQLASVSHAPPAARFDGGACDDFCIVYSSGTTGVPKGILFDHSAAIQHATVTALEFDISADSRYLVQIPHNSSINITIVPCLTVGAALGFEDSRGFDPVRFADRVERDAVTHSFVVPTMLFRLLEAVPDGSRLSSLKTLGYGSSPIPPDRVAVLVERFGPIFIQLYGMAEIASIGTLLRKSDHLAALSGHSRLFGSAGRPSYAVIVRVVDPSGVDVAVGERGEVIFAGPHIMSGYYRDPGRTVETIVDGWVHSGDVGVMDEEGYLYIVDRIKDLVIRGGHNIAPREIEEVLYSHPAVIEAAVIGVPDKEWGEAITAMVVVRPGATISGSELREWCRDSGLASIKIPGEVYLLDDLPKNQVGKFDKNAMKRIAAGGVGS